MITKLIPLTLCTLLLGASGCSDDFLTTELQGSSTRDNTMNTVGGAINVTNGCYQPLYTFYNTNWYQVLEIPSDDAFSFQADRPLENYAVSPTNAQFSGIWQNHYQGIARANYVLSNIDQTPFTEAQASLKSHIIGQALFLRGFYYFNLVRLFGGVPIYLNEIVTPQDAVKDRNSIEEVYAQIEADLEESQLLLSPKSSLTGASGSGFEKGRASKEVATAVLAWVYLTQEKWTEAADAASSVMTSFSLMPTYSSNFQGAGELNNESVFEVQYNEASAFGSILPRVGAPSSVLAGSGGIFSELIATDDNVTWLPSEPVDGNGIVQIFDQGDLRKDVTVSTYGRTSSVFVTGQPMELHAYKYWNPSYARPLSTNVSNSSGINFIIMRYADVLLIYAESLNETTGVDASTIESVNQIRRRSRGLPLGTPDPSIDLPFSLTQSQLRDSIRLERRREFAFEGKRWFDLNRWGILGETLALQGRTVPEGAIIVHPITGKSQFLYPIPQRERDVNPALTQNEGY